MINDNPFVNNRAEYMVDLWKYYVPVKVVSNGLKPLIVEGGRGTGKTMFFLCNSWRSKFGEYATKTVSPIREFLKEQMVGLYYKVDPDFVEAMAENDRNKTECEGIFGTYLSAVFSKELFLLLLKAQEEGLINFRDESALVRKYCSTFRRNDHILKSLTDITTDIESLLIDIEDVINHPGIEIQSFRTMRGGTGITRIVEEVKKINIFSEITIRIYVDEYESLVMWQQKIINTLIKKSDKNIVVNIAMKPMGMKTFSTLADEEQLQETHDYTHIKLDDLLENENYGNIIMQICEKRLKMFAVANQLNLWSYSVRELLGEYDVQQELNLLTESDGMKFRPLLRELITKQKNANNEEAITILCDKAPLLNARLHFALLSRTKYAPTVDELLEYYNDWCAQKKNSGSKKYAEWLHNAKNGLVFLLAKECHGKKMYFGFDMFIALSSGTIRYFLELCEQAVNIAIREGYEWDEQKIIPIQCQTRAAYLVSKKKIAEIESYADAGKRLRIFTQCLGEIFQDLHRNIRQTLAEPEPNHFSTDTLDQSEELKKYLATAVQWSVLQATRSTKDKDTIKTNIVDYHLNKIYAPYFGISCYRKRKIKISSEELEHLFSGNLNEAEEAARMFLNTYWRKQRDGSYMQISLFDEE